MRTALTALLFTFLFLIVGLPAHAGGRRDSELDAARQADDAARAQQQAADMARLAAAQAAKEAKQQDQICAS